MLRYEPVICRHYMNVWFNIFLTQLDSPRMLVVKTKCNIGSDFGFCWLDVTILWGEREGSSDRVVINMIAIGLRLDEEERSESTV